MPIIRKYLVHVIDPIDLFSRELHVSKAIHIDNQIYVLKAFDNIKIVGLYSTNTPLLTNYSQVYTCTFYKMSDQNCQLFGKFMHLVSTTLGFFLIYTAKH